MTDIIIIFKYLLVTPLLYYYHQNSSFVPDNLWTTKTVNCSETIIVPSIPTCDLPFVIYPLHDNITSNISLSYFMPPGVKQIEWVDNESLERVCVQTIEVQRDADLCGYGYCGYMPLSCICPPGTSGRYCCYGNDTTACGGNIQGLCGPYATCECLDGYGGAWCCPEDPITNTTCSSNGCCTIDGLCECFADTTDLIDPYTCYANTTSIPPPQTGVLTKPQIVAVTTVSATVGAALFVAIIRTLVPRVLRPRHIIPYR